MLRVAKFEKISEGEYNKAMEESKTDSFLSYSALELPERSTKLSAGYDFKLPYNITLTPGADVVVKTGIRAKIEPGWFLMCAPRSGMGFKYYARLANTVGIIDADYYNSSNEGHIAIKIRNEGSRTIEMKAGEKFCQGIFIPHGITFSDNADGIRDGGFGSTGK